MNPPGSGQPVSLASASLPAMTRRQGWSPPTRNDPCNVDDSNRILHSKYLIINSLAGTGPLVKRVGLWIVILVLTSSVSGLAMGPTVVFPATYSSPQLDANLFTTSTPTAARNDEDTSAAPFEPVREIHEAVRLYTLAVQASADDLDRALALLRHARTTLDGIRGTGDVPATAGQLAAHVINAQRILRNRHAQLRKIASEASRVLHHDRRPRAAIAVINALPICGDTPNANTFSSDVLTKPCWPTSDLHIGVKQVRQGAEDALASADAFVREADVAAQTCRDARVALAAYRKAQKLNRDLTLEDRIRTAESCLPGPPWGGITAVAAIAAAGFLITDYVGSSTR